VECEINETNESNGTCFLGQTDRGFFLKPKHVVVGLKKYICIVFINYPYWFL
jgi:hypothetical protein